MDFEFDALGMSYFTGDGIVQLSRDVFLAALPPPIVSIRAGILRIDGARSAFSADIVENALTPSLDIILHAIRHQQHLIPQPTVVGVIYESVSKVS